MVTSISTKKPVREFTSDWKNHCKEQASFCTRMEALFGPTHLNVVVYTIDWLSCKRRHSIPWICWISLFWPFEVLYFLKKFSEKHIIMQNIAKITANNDVHGRRTLLQIHQEETALVYWKDVYSTRSKRRAWWKNRITLLSSFFSFHFFLFAYLYSVAAHQHSSTGVQRGGVAAGNMSCHTQSPPYGSISHLVFPYMFITSIHKPLSKKGMNNMYCSAKGLKYVPLPCVSPTIATTTATTTAIEMLPLFCPPRAIADPLR